MRLAKWSGKHATGSRSPGLSAQVKLCWHEETMHHSAASVRCTLTSIVGKLFGRGGAQNQNNGEEDELDDHQPQPQEPPACTGAVLRALQQLQCQQACE